MSLNDRVRHLLPNRAADEAARRQAARYSGPRLKPIFVGGTGRSGTQVTARLLGAHPDVWFVPTEVRFIAAAGGLCDLVEGRTDVRAFEKRLLGRWFQRKPGGMHRFTDRTTVEGIFRKHRSGLKSEPRGRRAAFTHDLLDPFAAAAGAVSWAEMTPANVLVAPDAARALPGHAAHPQRPRWPRRGLLGDPAAVGPDGRGRGTRLVGGQGRGGLRSVRVRFLPNASWWCRWRTSSSVTAIASCRACWGSSGSRTIPPCATFFDSDVTPARAHIGRWTHDVPAERLAAFEAHYQRLAAELRDRGRAYMADSQPAVV